VLTVVAEIDPEVDFDSRRAVYFRQMRYGLFVSFVLSFFSNGFLTLSDRSAWPSLPASWADFILVRGATKQN
jgi:hypothetical protein